MAVENYGARVDQSGPGVSAVDFEEQEQTEKWRNARRRGIINICLLFVHLYNPGWLIRV